MGQVIKVAAMAGDGISPEVYPYGKAVWQAAHELSGRKILEVTELPNFDVDYFLKHGQAWEPWRAQWLTEKTDALFLVALGDVRNGKSVMDHAFQIIIDYARRKCDTNYNKRPYELLHPDLRPLRPHKSINVELFSPDQSHAIKEIVSYAGTADEVVSVYEVHEESAIREIFRRAIERAEALGLEWVPVLHKANILKPAHELIEKVCAELRPTTPVKLVSLYADAFLERFVKAPHLTPEVIIAPDRAIAALLKPALRVLASGDIGEIQDNFEGVVGRENTEGMYIQKGEIEDRPEGRVAIQHGVHTYKRAYANILESAVLSKKRLYSNVLVGYLDDVHPKVADLYMRAGKEVGLVMDCVVEFRHAGNILADMLSEPEQVNRIVISVENLLGDMFGDATAGLIGGLGLMPTASSNTTGLTNKFFFEPCHGSAPDIKGKAKADPIATMLTVGEMLEAAGHIKLNDALRWSVAAVIERGIRTPDLGGTATTTELGVAIVEQFREIVLSGKM